jgi:hypothetical protein
MVTGVSQHPAFEETASRTRIRSMLNRLRPHYGKLFYAVGTAHLAVSIIQFRDEWGNLFRDGFFNVIDEQAAPYQGLGYWFFILGPVLITTGALTQSHLNATGTLPRAFSLTIAGISFPAGLAMYANGIWAVGLLGLLGLAYAPPEHGSEPTRRSETRSVPASTRPEPSNTKPPRRQFVV